MLARAGAVLPRSGARLRSAAQAHIDASLPHLGADYMGEHWLASFAVLALGATEQEAHPPSSMA